MDLFMGKFWLTICQMYDNEMEYGIVYSIKC